MVFYLLSFATSALHVFFRGGNRNKNNIQKWYTLRSGCYRSYSYTTPDFENQFPTLRATNAKAMFQYEKYEKRISYLKELIEKQSTGTPKELAKRLGISERMLYNYFDPLRNSERTVRFDRKRKSFIFSSLQ